MLGISRRIASSKATNIVGITNTSDVFPKRIASSLKSSCRTYQISMMTKPQASGKNKSTKLLESNSIPLLIATRGFKINNVKGLTSSEDVSYLFSPIQYEQSLLDANIGEELAGPINRDKLLELVNTFYVNEIVRELAKEHGLDKYLFQQTILSFRQYCKDGKVFPTEMHILITDLLKGSKHVHELYPHFLAYARKIFPHLDCLDDLCHISDLSRPPNWYPAARQMDRKIIFHAGPTNSGKTYHAMQKFLAAGSGIYCGPLKMLAVEVSQKSIDEGTPCDLVTGEERKYAINEDSPAHHVSCTIEMASVNTQYDVAVIDEIQMMKDQGRGWAWTRALMGLCAKEIHICGETAAIDLVKQLAMSVGENVEVRKYKRLTPLTIENKALETLDNVQDGDCIVCFNKKDIHTVAQYMDKLGKQTAVIYGALPPGAKLAQANKFNDPDDPCNIMVATDAIGMGLNLSIRRVVFFSMHKPTINDEGEKSIDTITVSQALQIAGRAGRFNTHYAQGYATCLKPTDLPILKSLLRSTPPLIEQAGLHPTPDQIELFAYHLPQYSLCRLVNIFMSLSKVDASQYFMCLMDDFKFLADLINEIPMTLRSRYIFCCTPISKTKPFVCNIFMKFVREYSKGNPATSKWLLAQLKWPFNPPTNIEQLVHLEEIYDVIDIYLWLSYRFPDMFPDAENVRLFQKDLDCVIQVGVAKLTSLLNNTEALKLKKHIPRRKFIDKVSLFESLDFGNNDKYFKQNKPNASRKSTKITDRLVKEGVVSARMIELLKQEILASSAEEVSDTKKSGSDDR